MTHSLSPKEADEAVKKILPIIREKIKKSKEQYGFGQADFAIREIGDVSNTPDTYCKIAEAMFNYGIATDLKSGKQEILFRFRDAAPYDKRPSLETCSTRWNIM